MRFPCIFRGISSNSHVTNINQTKIHLIIEKSNRYLAGIVSQFGVSVCVQTSIISMHINNAYMNNSQFNCIEHSTGDTYFILFICNDDKHFQLRNSSITSREERAELTYSNATLRMRMLRISLGNLNVFPTIHFFFVLCFE